MRPKRVKFTGHVIRRMFERSIGQPDVLEVVSSGEMIAEYPDDTPYPSCLLLGFPHREALHVVVAFDEDSGTAHVITAYRPNPSLWSDDFRTRRSP